MAFRALSFACDGSDAGGVAAGAVLLLGARAGAVEGLLKLLRRRCFVCLLESFAVGDGLLKLVSMLGVGDRPFVQILLLLLQLLRSFVSACGPSACGVGGFLGLRLGTLRLAVTHHLYSLLLQLVLLLKLLLGLLCLIVK
tara:strand:+ start:330 stop:749 length:420 start_codon:yes stop_codon:yes gene_type:complete